MNQAFLFNDDLTFVAEQESWRITGMLSGQILTFYVKKETLLKLNSDLDEATLQFDIEALIEDWLEDNEAETDVILIK